MPKVSSLMFEVLDSLYGIETSLVSMYSPNDQYSWPPFFRFRFRNREKGNPVYQHIKDVAERFSGLLKWTIYTQEDVRNYLLVPELAVVFIQQNKYNKEALVAHFGEDGYRSFIDRAVKDISVLAKFLADHLSRAA